MHRTIGGAALIIGAGGIGAAVAAKIADEGLPVIMADLDPARAEATVAQLGDSAAAYHIDVTKALRQTILNLAVRGKLVAQDPEDEPAGELLK